jgi:phosphate-selective porin OprO/OprP
MQSMKSIPHALFAAGVFATGAANAEDKGVFSQGLTGESVYDKIWSAATLYKDDDNPFIQEFSLQGRLQLQYFNMDSNVGDLDTEDYKDASDANNERVWGDHFEVRRARFGFKSKLFRSFKFEGQIDVDTDADANLYKDLYDLFLTYSASDAFNISVGKTKVRFTREQEISSKEILTFERSLMANLLFPGELTGVWVNGKGIKGGWLYEAGVYGSDRQRDFSEFDAGAVFLGKVGYDYSSSANLDSAVASVHVMHNTEPGYLETTTANNYTPSASPSFGTSIALTNDINHGRFGLMTEAVYGFGDDRADVYGLTIIPSYFIADGLQLVGRFQVAASNGGDGISLPSRYEGLTNNGVVNAADRPALMDRTGSTYTAAYAGLNYYLHGHKLKLMTGIEYAKLGGGDYEGYTAMTGLRMFF